MIRLTMESPTPVPGNSESVQALEGPEQLVHILHVEADAVVADEIDGHAVAELGADR